MASEWALDAISVPGYQSINPNQTFPKDLPTGMGRHGASGLNRHHDILPNPRTRVVLQKVGPDAMTTYVNANYIPGPEGEARKYIAAMGPKMNTLGHFWRMVWENKVQAIVMTTNTIERGKDKCSVYWPRMVGASYAVNHGGIAVACLEKKEEKGFTRSRFEVRRVRETRIVEHFWYNTWPDHGVPTKDGRSFCDDVLQMLAVVNASVKNPGKDGNGPVLVHCSAGVGRTGTFIAIDHGIKCLQRDGKFRILETIRKLRQHRVALVQTKDQYCFVHAALVRYTQNCKHKPTVLAPEKAAAYVDVAPTAHVTLGMTAAAVPVEPVGGFTKADLGKEATVTLAGRAEPCKVVWMGAHPIRKNELIGILFPKPVGRMDGTLSSGGITYTFFKAAKQHGHLVSPANVTLTDGRHGQAGSAGASNPFAGAGGGGGGDAASLAENNPFASPKEPGNPFKAANPFVAAFDQLSSSTSTEAAGTAGTAGTTALTKEKEHLPVQHLIDSGVANRLAPKPKQKGPRPVRPTSPGSAPPPLGRKDPSPGRKDPKKAHSTDFGRMMDKVLDLEAQGANPVDVAARRKAAERAAELMRTQTDPWEAAKEEIGRLNKFKAMGLIDKETYASGADRALMVAKIKEMHLLGELEDPAYTAALVGALTHSKVAGFGM